MKRGSRVVLGAGFAAAVVFAVTACAGDPDTEEICVNRETMVEVDDDFCEDGHHGHTWFYVPYGSSHAKGSKVTVPGSYVKPASGTVGRGGFGGSRGGSSGG